jgi:hypothetical protein
MGASADAGNVRAGYSHQSYCPVNTRWRQLPTHETPKDLGESEGESMARRIIIGFTVFVFALCVTTFAQNVHLKGGRNAEPAFNDEGLFLSAAASLAGLGNGDVLITLSAEANVTATCENQGGNQAPGQNPAPITVSGSVSIPEEEIKNGTVSFNVPTIAPARFIPDAPDCPNPNWTEEITDISFTSATITVEQPLGTVVLTVTCSVSEPTSNGAVPGGSVTCTSS